ncbi:MAG: alanine dehydrogenase, partial [Clostridia bacterium]|nr:alanine dehydrogenase [Clostridia bacterium]
YRQMGATIVPDVAELYGAADLILKVKEPMPEEYGHYRPGHILFTYLHLAADAGLTRFLLDRRVAALAYETVQLADGSLPLLTPMSEIAGRMAVQVGVHYLERPQGGRGILLAGVPGVPPGDVVILGAGTVGMNAARIALGLGARVTVLDVNPRRLQYIDDLFRGQVTTLMSNAANVAEATRRADLLIGAVLVPGARAPHLVTRSQVAAMKPGAVVVDVAIDQGGSVETCDRPTTHQDPVYVRYGVIHYAVANMPGAVPRTATFALTNATLPYVLELADKGLAAAVRDNPALAAGVNLVAGHVVHRGVAATHGLPVASLHEVLAERAAP